MPQKDSAEKAVRDIRRKTRRKFSAEEKIWIVLEGLRGEILPRADCVLIAGYSAGPPETPPRAQAYGLADQ